MAGIFNRNSSCIAHRDPHQ